MNKTRCSIWLTGQIKVLLSLLAWILVCTASLSASAAPSPESETKAQTAPSDAPPSREAQPERGSSDAPLRVGFAGSSPFVLSDRPAGASVGAFELVAKRAGLSYKLIRQPDVPTAIAQVKAGKLDAAVGPITITADRLRDVAFSQPYFRTALGIAAPEGSASLFKRFAPFLTKAFFGGIFVLLTVLGIVGTLIWLVERKKNSEHFPSHPVRGIGNGIWFALVTMTTVGYGDKAPMTIPGRVVAGAWMLVALVTTTSLIAGIASAVTVAQVNPATIRDAGDLTDQRVAVVKGTTSAQFARSHEAIIVPAPNLEAAFELVRTGKASALVHDRPMLSHYLNQHPDLDLQLASKQYEPQNYGTAFSQGSSLLIPFDVALLEEFEEGRLSDEIARWVAID